MSSTGNSACAFRKNPDKFEDFVRGVGQQIDAPTLNIFTVPRTSEANARNLHMSFGAPSHGHSHMDQCRIRAQGCQIMAPGPQPCQIICIHVESGLAVLKLYKIVWNPSAGQSDKTLVPNPVASEFSRPKLAKKCPDAVLR